ncbi:MAG: tetratricopeptide repeat protein [Leptospirillia bacterium]
MRKTGVLLWGALGWLLLSGASLGEHLKVEEANRALATGDPATAEARYREVIEASPDDPALRYNLGAAMKAGGDHAEALRLWGAVAAEGMQAPDGEADGDDGVAPGLAASAAFNLGNTLLEQATPPPGGPSAESLPGGAPGGDTSAAMQALTAAIKSYRAAIALDPESEDARHNLQIAAIRRAELEQMQQQQQSGESSEQGDQGEQGESSEGGQGQPQKGGESGSEDTRSGGDPESGNKDGEQSAAAGEKDGTQDQGESGETAGNGEDDDGTDGSGAAQNGVAQIRAEDMERILSGMARGEAEVMREALRRTMGPASTVERDW